MAFVDPYHLSKILEQKLPINHEGDSDEPPTRYSGITKVNSYNLFYGYENTSGTMQMQILHDQTTERLRIHQWKIYVKRLKETEGSNPTAEVHAVINL